MRAIVSVMLCLGVAACGAAENRPEPPARVPYVFEGVSYPGTMATAKAEGFTDCTTDFRCTTASPPSLLGVQTEKAEVRFAYKDYYAESQSGKDLPQTRRALSDLAYDTVVYYVTQGEYDPVCQARYSFVPAHECQTGPGGVGRLRQALDAQGWVSWKNGEFTTYYKPGEPVSVTVFQPIGAGLLLRVVVDWDTPDVAAAGLADVQARRASEQADADKRKAFVEGMKG